MEKLRSIKNKSKYIYWSIIALVVFIALKFGKLIFSKIKGLFHNINQTTSDSTAVVNFNAYETAQKIYAAHYSNDWFGFSEDEKAASEALFRAPSSAYSQINNAYMGLSGKDLTNDIYRFWGSDLIDAFEAWRQ